MSDIFGKDSNSYAEFSTSNEYAKNYNDWRKKEELNKLKTKYGDDTIEQLEDESSSSSDDDEEGIELTEQVEKDFYKTLSYLKNKDPRIYDENVHFFQDSGVVRSSNKKEKPMFLKDYERKLILEKKCDFSDDENGEDRPVLPTYVQEQEQIKKSLKNALEQVDEDDNEWGGMLKSRQKTEAEKQKEEADYREWLAGQTEKLDDKQAETDLKPLKEYWNNPSLDKGEKFLRDYVLNKQFLSNEDEDYIPTYEEVIHDSDKDLSEDEEEIEKQEEFEHKYNFRFEEPDQDFIKRYPRTVEQSLRKSDDKRSAKRAETKERKHREKEQKVQDLKKLQEFKRKEIEEKILKLKEITGNTDIAFEDQDLDGDFDPEAHDKRMRALFDDEFYQGEEEELKPKFPELDDYLELENWDNWQGKDEEEAGPSGNHCEDDDFNMDCDYNPSTAEEMIENCKGKKKRKRKSLFAKAVSQPKPVFDPNDKTYEEYLDEYYKFDCEDIIGDIPCKFKYRKVVPNSFGLTIDEILNANDRELNKWCSLKKAVQYRPDHVEKYDQIAFSKKAANVDLKRKILPSLFEKDERKKAIEPPTTIKSDKIVTQEEEINDEKVAKPKRNKKKSKVVGEITSEQPEVGASNVNEKKTKKRKANNEIVVPTKKSKKNKRKNEKIGLTDARLSAYGMNPKKFKNKLKYAGK